MDKQEINFATIASLLLNLEKVCEIGQEKKCTRNQSTFWREMIDISCSTVQEVVENSFVVEGCLESLTAYKFYSNIGTSCQLSVVKFFRGHQKKIDQISYDCQLWQERKRDISVAKKVNRLSRLSTDFLGRDPLSKIKMYYQKIQVLHSFLGLFRSIVKRPAAKIKVYWPFNQTYVFEVPKEQNPFYYFPLHTNMVLTYPRGLHSIQFQSPCAT